MIIHDFDNKTEPVVKIEHFYGEQKHIVEKCLIIFSKEIHDYLLKSYDCTVIGTCVSCAWRKDIYCFELNGEKVAFYLSPIGSAIAAGTCYEAHWLTGATKFVMFGSCGSLDKVKTFGKYIVPTESYRGEGCSYYYAEPSDYIKIEKAEKVACIFDEVKIPYVKGRTWTTDSMLRETVGLVQKRRSEGCIAVEMELAGVEAICDFYGLELYDFLEAGDVLEESGYDVSELSGANHNIGKLFAAFEILKRI